MENLAIPSVRNRNYGTILPVKIGIAEEIDGKHFQNISTSCN